MDIGGWVEVKWSIFLSSHKRRRNQLKPCLEHDGCFAGWYCLRVANDELYTYIMIELKFFESVDSNVCAGSLAAVHRRGTSSLNGGSRLRELSGWKKKLY